MWSIYDFQANNYRQVDFRMIFFLQTGFDMENCIISSKIDTYSDYDTRNVLGHYGVIIKRRQALDNVFFFSCSWDQVFCVSHRLICEASQVMGVKWGIWALTLYIFSVNSGTNTHGLLRKYSCWLVWNLPSTKMFLLKLLNKAADIPPNQQTREIYVCTSPSILATVICMPFKCKAKSKMRKIWKKES